mgnify:CR=1 FL=1
MRKSFTVYELFYSSPESSWEPAAESYVTLVEAKEGLRKLKKLKPSAFIVRTVRARVV